MQTFSSSISNRRPRTGRQWFLFPALLIITILSLGAAAQDSEKAGLLASSVSSSPSVSTGVVINEIYAGAGCTTAGCSLYGNDYVELKNIGLTAVNITGWTIQYKSATGITTTFAASNPLSGIIQPGDTFLVVLTAGAAGTGLNTVPTGNGTGSLSLSNTGGRVVLVNNSTPLDATTSCATQLAAPSVVDYVGYGTAICFEGAAAAPAPTSTSTSLNRVAGPDTDQNSVDFVNATPTPQAATSPTAGEVSISGRVLSPDGRGITNARITVSGDSLTEPITVVTGRRGGFSVDGLTAGESYIVTVVSRRFTFDEATRAITPTDSLSGFDFVADGARRSAKADFR